jgi:hypothetical protein
MATYKPATRTDYNLTGDFSGEDLDISWAHLQVKALVESQNSTTITIGGENFDTSVVPGLKAAVQKMYTTNVDSQIASPSLGDTYDIPETLQTPNYINLWKVNDCIPHDDTSDNSNNTPAVVFDSITGSSTGALSGSYYWARSGKNDAQALRLQSNSGKLILDDSANAVNNNGPYSFGFTCKSTDWGDSIIVKKDTTTIKMIATGVEIKNQKTGKKIVFAYPNGKVKGDYLNKEFQFTMQRFKTLAANGSTIAITKAFLDGEECVQTSATNQASIISNIKGDIVFKHRPLITVRDIFVTRELISFKKDTESLFFASRLDQTNSFNSVTSVNELLGDFGGYALITDMPGVAGQTNAWREVVTSGTNANGLPPNVSRNLTVGAGRNIIIENFDLSKNFTISFWSRNLGKNYCEPMDFKNESGDTLSIKLLGTGKLDMIYPDLTRVITSKISDNWRDNYNHILINKNGGFVDVYANGVHNTKKSISVDKLQNMTSTTISIGGTNPTFSYWHLMSSLKIFGYAVCPPYINGQTSHLALPIVERIKNNLV